MRRTPGNGRPLLKMLYYIIEAFIIIITFMLPGFLLPPIENPNDFLNSPVHLGVYIILSFLYILFVIFILTRDKKFHIEDFGFIKPQLRDILSAIFYASGLFLIYFILIFIISLLPDGIREILFGGFRWEPENRLLIPLLFIFSFITGYKEELLFRSYIITRSSQLNIPVPVAIGIGVAAFSLLHSYEGISGILFALFSSIYLSLIFIVKRNIHLIAWCHGIFNFCAILLSFIGNG
jgi:membrane protease YdiL (CAAX protease family)